MGSFVLGIFSLAIAVFQISCQKTVSAQSGNYILPVATTTNLGGVIVGNGLTISSSGVLSASSGTQLENQNQILFLYSDTVLRLYDYKGNTNGVNLAHNLVPYLYTNYIVDAKFSPDKSLIFVHTRRLTSLGSDPDFVYSMDANGDNVKKIITGERLSNLNVMDVR